jgi:hypothetical protein
VTLVTNTTGLDGGVGQFATGTFTANNLSEVITFTSNNQIRLSGLQLRQLPSAVPEPTSLTLLFIGVVLFGATVGDGRSKLREARPTTCYPEGHLPGRLFFQ